MSFGISPLGAVILASLLSFALGFVTRKILSSRRIAQAEVRAQELLNESKSKAQDILLESKNKALKILEDAKKEEKERNVQLAKIENLLTKKEEELEERSKELHQEKDLLKAKDGELTILKTDL